MGLNVLLSALGYPQSSSFDVSSKHAVPKLVAWLENSKIRHYKPPERKDINNINGPQWHSAYEKYLKDLQCPLPTPYQQTLQEMEWLIAYAISLEYEDQAESINVLVQPLEAVQKESADEGCHNVFQEDLSQLAHLLRLEVDDADSLTKLKAIRAAIKDSIVPAVEGGKEGMDQLLSTSTLGFDTGDAMLNKVAAALRVLYIHDLRKLQTQVDHALITLQEYTANPKTDASLGKVGR